ncbi:MAG: alpha/beta hydrolase [Deltaproteobacteria bacterium]|nr:alpha/beta hydrolase [Deltaproteobacteria bacterium]
MALLMLEGQRALFEAMTLPGAAPLLRRAPRGDGHPVLVLPGFTAGDGSTRVLRRYLKNQGYASHPWLLGQNLGPSGDLRNRLRARVDELSRRYQQPISIVGWSLGGIYARQLAKAAPEFVRQVVTLGSPFADTQRPSNASRLFRSVSGNREPERSDKFARSLRTPPSVPSTAIFSRTDGVVHWSACLEPKTDHTENIEVPGSHCGLGLNPLVLYAVTDRLSQTPGAWKPFDRSGWRRHFYRNPPPD